MQRLCLGDWERWPQPGLPGSLLPAATPHPPPKPVALCAASTCMIHAVAENWLLLLLLLLEQMWMCQQQEGRLLCSSVGGRLHPRGECSGRCCRSTAGPPLWEAVSGTCTAAPAVGYAVGFVGSLRFQKTKVLVSMLYRYRLMQNRRIWVCLPCLKTIRQCTAGGKRSCFCVG